VKGIYAILASLMFFLAVKPCSDDGVQQFESMIEMVCHLDNHSGDHEHTTTHDHNHDEDADDCSPFCSCDCCGTHMEEAFVIQSFMALYSSPQVHNTIYYNNFDGDHFGNHFQPPQV